jgi:hypothetical protein
VLAHKEDVEQGRQSRGSNSYSYSYEVPFNLYGEPGFRVILRDFSTSM